MIPQNWIEIGTVKSVNPARREVRVVAKAAHVHEFDQLVWLRLNLSDGTHLRCRVKELKGGEEEYLVSFVPGVPRDNVARMKKAVAVVAEDERKPRADGSVHVSELPELKVFSKDGAVIGTVVAAYETGANDVIEVEKPDGKIILLPVIEQLVESIDVEQGSLIVGDMTPYVVEEE